MHAAAAVPCAKEGLLNRPCVVIAGGREPAQWEAYPHHRYLCTNGALNCCDNGGCWKSRTVKLNDGDENDKADKLCIYPINKNGFNIPKCMDMISTESVIQSIEMYYNGGVLNH
jgi:hypothetical protein